MYGDSPIVSSLLSEKLYTYELYKITPLKGGLSWIKINVKHIKTIIKENINAFFFYIYIKIQIRICPFKLSQD